MNRLSIVIILYNPPDEVIQKWVNFTCQNQDVNIIFVDNSIKSNWCSTQINCVYIPLKENKGIATAQNEGIKQAIRDGADYIVFFDQDSDVDADFCSSLLCEYKRIKQVEPKLAILGPTVVNKDTGIDYKSNGQDTNNGYSIVGALISSGTLVEVNALRNVGMMEDDLFIDAVDFEWCWRASSKGYVCARTPHVKLPHKVGQNSRTILGMPFIVSAPFRYYYQYRNWLLLIRRSYVPDKWKIKTSVRKMIELFVIPFLAENRIQTILNMWRGIIHGFIKKIITNEKNICLWN